MDVERGRKAPLRTFRQAAANGGFEPEADLPKDVSQLRLFGGAISVGVNDSQGLYWHIPLCEY